MSLSISNHNPNPLPGPQLLHQLVVQQSKKDQIAIEFCAADGLISRLTYNELHIRTNRLANRLLDTLKIATTSSKRLIVPIFIQQSIQLYIAQLASLKAGGAFCPISLDVPEERLRFILDDVDAAVLLTTSDQRENLPDLENVQVITIDEDNEDSDSSEPLIAIAPQSPAYVLYTSGSTGQPKGVLIPHASATQALLAHDKHIPNFTRFLQFASPTFDVSVFEIFFPWFRGATLVSCDRRRLLNDLPSVIEELQIDAAELTPSVANNLLRGRRSVPSLKILLTIGEMLKPGVVDEFGGSDDEPGILHGMYGPTEATIHCTLHTHFPKDMSCGSIGIPLDTVSAFVVRPPPEDNSSTDEVVILPLGEEGELAIGGHQLAEGYLNREEQTRAAFVRHPEYGRLYRTGDRAKMLPDGRFECLGRISSGQVKLRGQRIELGEIEYAASKTPGCRSSVAEVISGILVMFCVGEDASLTEKSVRETCQQWLPSFMVPGDVIILQGLPYLNSGKLDRKALHRIYTESHTETEGTDVPQDESTRDVINVLENVLGCSVKASSKLLSLGLDSLASIRIAAELKRKSYPQLDATQILVARTPLDIASDLKKLQAETEIPNTTSSDAEGEASDVPVGQFSEVVPSIHDIDYAFRCTAVQCAMLGETHKNSEMYCNWIELQVAADSDALKSAFLQLSDKHPLLRSGFTLLSGGEATFATIVWKRLLAEQIKVVGTLDYNFRIESEHDFLHPLSVQILDSGKGSRFLLQIHHALYDQWSIDVLRADLSTLLAQRDTTRPPGFDVVAAHHAGSRPLVTSNASFEFWQDYLRNATFSALPSLTAKKGPPALQSTTWQTTQISSSHLKTQSQGLRCSSPAVFQAALSYLIGSYVGSKDVVLGSVFSGRTIAVSDIDRIFGPCLATLPLRIDVSSAHTRQDLLSAITQLNRNLQKHLMTPPQLIKKAAGISPGSSMFDVLFVWQQSSIENDNIVKELNSADRHEFNLVLEFDPAEEYVRARATYRQNVMSAQQIDILLRQVEAIAMEILQQPSQSVDDLGMTLKSNLLSIANPQYDSAVPPQDLVSILEATAMSNSKLPAIVFTDDMEIVSPNFVSISYGELDSRSNQLANALISFGTLPDDLVCICMDKCIDLYVAIIATIKAGAGYLPLLPETPQARVKSILSQSPTKICLCDSASASSFGDYPNTQVVDMATLDFSKLSVSRPKVSQHGSRIAYSVYTSGSTGEPKGVPVTLDNLHGNLEVLSELYETQPGDRLLQACSQAFDVSVFEIFFTFYRGMTLCSATKDALFRDFEHSINSFGITHLSLTPTVAALVDSKNVPTVRFLVTAGEAITDKVFNEWATHGLHQGYGPSETTNICTVNMNVSTEDAINNVGPPFRNTSAFVIAPGEDFRVLPAGSFGEFAFGGEQVFPGYVARPDLNAQKIIDHPDFGRVYRSGDTGHILHDGTLLISGRLDDQVKIRGNRVELGEINAVLMRRQDIVDSTVLVFGRGSSDQSISAFFVPISESSSGNIQIANSDAKVINEIFGSLQGSLPSYMVPSAVIPVTHLPRTSQGKLDKRRLETIWSQLTNDERTRFSVSHDDDDSNEPFGPGEEAMAHKLAETLSIAPASINRHTSFFALGLNSLNAIKFAKSIEPIIKARVNVTTILRNPSVARLSTSLTTMNKPSESNKAIQPQEVFQAKFLETVRRNFGSQNQVIEAILPCTPLQEAMLSASGSADSDAYSNLTKLRVIGDVKKLKECWRTVVQRHSVLRTTFIETSTAAHPYAQVILRNDAFPWFDMTDMKLQNGNGTDHTNEDQNGFVSPSHPLRIELRSGQKSLELTLLMHHAIYDGVSMSNLFTEIERIYRGEELPQPVPFEPFLAEVASQNITQALEYWSEKFKGFQPHPLPKPTEQKVSQERTVCADLNNFSNQLAGFCETHSVTALSIYQAAWVKTLSCAQGVKDVCFGNVVSGRTGTIPHVENLIAPCFNTIPLRTDLDSVHSNIDLIRHLHKGNVDNLDFQLTALRRIQTFSADPSTHLFDSLLLLQPPSEPLDSDLWTPESETGSMDLPLVMEIVPHGSDVKFNLHFLDGDIIAEIADVLLDGFVAALNSCTQFVSSSVDNFLNFDASTISGKLIPDDAHAHEDINGVNGHSTDDHEWTSTESIIREIFAELSGVEASKISKNTSLYQIGLDSLNAVQVASQLRQRNYAVDAADVMQHRTPTSIAIAIPELTESEPDSRGKVDFQSFDDKHRSHIVESTGLDSRNLDAVRPCTPAQKGMLAQSLQSDGRLYINHLAYRIPGQFDQTQIQHAWAKVQRKHQILRTGFAQLEDQKNPFVMLVHTFGENLDSTNVVTTSEKFDEHDATTQVIERLYLPVWRVHLSKTAELGDVMYLTIHHAVYDADSLQILLSDFAHALRSQDIGSPVNLDAVLSSALQVSENDREGNEKFWANALESAGFAKFPNLCPTVVSEANMETAQLTSSVDHSALDTFCRHNGVTVQAIGQSIWAVLLAAYTGEAGVTFGTVFSGHASNTSVGVAFPSITTIPVFCDTTRPILELIKDMLSFNASSQKHRFTPLTDIQRYAGKAGQTLFDSVFVYQKSSLSPDDRFDWELVSQTAAVDYNVSLELILPAHSNCELCLTFNTRIVPAEHGSLMLRQYESLLQKLLKPDDSEEQIFDNIWSVLPAKEDVLPTTVSCLHEFVEIGARNHPDKPALEFITSFEADSKGRTILTYRELDEQSNQVAHVLQKAGVRPGGVVAVCAPKCLEASLAFTAISKVGCAFLAMDPELPAARKQFILEDSQSQALFIGSEATWDLEGNAHIIECKPGFFADMPTSPVETPPVDPQATSYILYTSGTTGTPKGCELTHDNAIQAMMSFQRLFSGHWTQESRWLQFASYWFDVSVLEQFWTWSVGITMVGAPRDLILGDLIEFIREANITHIDLTPSLARLVTPSDVPSLCNGVFITGGEALKQEIINAWGPEKVICNGYGPTEATIGVTMNRFIGTDAKPSNIGKQFDNVGTLVLEPDSDMPVLCGGVGELCISGKLVGKGYLNRPEQTAKAFPYLDRFRQKVYRTGDLVRMLSDGSFSFIGRKDTQAKLRGQRLEIDEIDSVIRSASDDISEVASLVSKGADGNKEMLISFIAFEEPRRSDPSMDSSESAKTHVQRAHQACRDYLPGYMVPTHVIPVSNLPLTVNNKVDSKRLVSFFQSLGQQDLQRLRDNEKDARQMSAAEKKIAQALHKLLDISEDEVAPSSNIFSLGLSSISAINLTTILKRHGFKNASVANVMNNPTIERLAKAMVAATEGNRVEENAIKQAQLIISAFSQRFRSFAAAALSKSVSDIESLAPCTPLQEGLLLESAKSGNKLYFNEFVYEVKQADASRLAQALGQTISDIQMLRTVFVRTDDGFAQVVLKKPDVAIHQHDTTEQKLEHLLLRQRELWQANSTQDIVLPFEAVIARTPTKTILALHAHHAIYDGISWDLTMQFLEHAYSSDTHSDMGPSFIKALPYGPLCVRPDSKAFWTERLQDVTFCPLPSVSQDSNQEANTVRSTLHFTESNETFRRKLGVSHQAIFEAAFVAALSHQFPETQTYGVVVSGRSISLSDADSVMGPMFNTIPSAINIKSSDTWSDHMKRCHEANVASLPFQHTPLRDIRKFCGRPSAEPMFDVLFVFQRREKSTNDSIFQEIESQVNPDYPLAIEVELLDSGEVTVIAVAKPSVNATQTLHDLVNKFQDAFKCLMDNSGGKVGDELSIPDKPRHQLSNNRINGVHQSNGHAETPWNPQGLAIRDAIVQLADCETDDVDQDTTIFSLGLDSIDVVKLSARLRKSSITIPVSRILQAQTIDKMLDTIETGENGHGSSSIDRLGALEEQLRPLREQLSLQDGLDLERVIPASPSQEAMIAEMFRSEFQEYYNYDILRLHPDTDLKKLESAWQRVVDASPILRTSFVEVTDSQIDAVFAQVVHRPSTLSFDVVNAQSVETLSKSFESIRTEVSKSFTSKPSLRFTIATIRTERYLLLSISHAQYDGHSLALIHEDVGNAYKDQFEQRPAYDFTLDEALRATSSDAVKFWQGSLTGSKISRVVGRREKSSDDVVHRAERVCSSPALKSRTRCQRLGISLQTLAQAAWAATLAELSHSLEVMFGVVLACRDNEEAEQVLFPTMNTVPLKALLHGSKHQMLQYVQSTMNDILPYQRTPLRAIQRACAGVVDRNGVQDGNGLFDTLFIYQHRPESSESEQGSIYESVKGSSNIDYPIAVELEAVNDQFLVRAACKDSVMSQADTDDLLRKYDHVLSTLIENSDDPCVTFDDEEVSVCGLPSFTLESSEPTGQSDVADDADATDDTDLDTSPVKESIKSALSQVSGVPVAEIALDATIESIGIDSISAIKVAALLKKQSIKLSVSDMLKASTLNKMAKSAEEQAGFTNTPQTSSTEILNKATQILNVDQILAEAGMSQNNVESVLPASAGQQYMLELWQKTGGQIFMPTFQYRLSKAFSTDDIRDAWAKTVEHQPLLRTVFCNTQSHQIPLLQVILKHSPNTFFSSDSQRGVYAQQPMASLTLDSSSSSLVLNLHIHHALYDAVSLPLIVESFQSFLLLHLHHSKPSSPQLATSFPDFLALSFDPSTQSTRENFWKAYLEDVHPVILPSPSKSQGPQIKFEIFKPSLLISASGLEAMARKKGMPLQALLFAAYAKVYSRMFATRDSDRHDGDGGAKDGKDGKDVILGIYLSNRSQLPELDSLPAPTLNLLPLVVRNAEGRELWEVAEGIRKDLREFGRKEICGTGLGEIERWSSGATPLAVQGYVNFLKVPVGEEKDEEKEGNERVVEGIEGEVRKERSLVLDLNSEGGEEGGEKKEGFEMPEGLRGREVGSAYQVSGSREWREDGSAYQVSGSREWREDDDDFRERRNRLTILQHSVDVEITVAGGVLDLGLFGPVEMVGLEQAEKAIEEFKKLLEGLVGGE